MVDEIRKVPYIKRKDEALRLVHKYSTRVPIIIFPDKRSKLPKSDSSKFLVPKDMVLSQFIIMLRKRIFLDSSQAIFLFSTSVSENKKTTTLIPSSETFGEIYEANRDLDGFLYLVYSEDAVFGIDHAS